MLARIITIAALTSLVGAAAASGAMHARLTKAEPGIGATVTTAPTQVRLWFSEAPVLDFTAVTLLKSEGTVVAKLTMAATDDQKSVAGPIPVPIAPGDYILSWRTASDDGHAARGKYKFTYRAP